MTVIENKSMLREVRGIPVDLNSDHAVQFNNRLDRLVRLNPDVSIEELRGRALADVFPGRPERTNVQSDHSPN